MSVLGFIMKPGWLSNQKFWVDLLSTGYCTQAKLLHSTVADYGGWSNGWNNDRDDRGYYGGHNGYNGFRGYYNRGWYNRFRGFNGYNRNYWG